MKFKLYKASKLDSKENLEVDINSIEDLVSLWIDENNNGLIIDFEEPASITVYDDYLE